MDSRRQNERTFGVEGLPGEDSNQTAIDYFRSECQNPTKRLAKAALMKKVGEAMALSVLDEASPPGTLGESTG